MTSVNIAGINPSIRPISKTERRDKGISPIDEWMNLEIIREELKVKRKIRRKVKQQLKKSQFMMYLNLILMPRYGVLVWLDDLCCLRRRMSKSISRCTCTTARGASIALQASQG